jgi:hypothetical protein
MPPKHYLEIWLVAVRAWMCSGQCQPQVFLHLFDNIIHLHIHSQLLSINLTLFTFKKKGAFVQNWYPENSYGTEYLTFDRSNLTRGHQKNTSYDLHLAPCHSYNRMTYRSSCKECGCSLTRVRWQSHNADMQHKNEVFP